MPSPAVTEETLHVLYASVCSEITRYRDREWTNVTLFTSAIAAVIGFAVSQRSLDPPEKFLLDSVLVALAGANIFYTSFAHDRLCIQQERQDRLFNLLIEPTGENVEIEKIFARAKTGWATLKRVLSRGFLSHLLPFFLTDVVLCVCGIYLVHSQ